MRGSVVVITNDFPLRWCSVNLSTHNTSTLVDVGFSDTGHRLLGNLKHLQNILFQCKILGAEGLQGAHIGGTNINAVRCDLEKLMNSEEYHSSWLRTTTKATTVPTTITPMASTVLLAKKKSVPDLYPYPSILLRRHPLLWAKHSFELRFLCVIKTVMFGEYKVIWERAPIVYIRSIWMKSKSKRPDRLNAFYTLTLLLQVCANITFKYKNRRPRPSIEILLQSPHSYHLWHHLPTSPCLTSSHRLPRFYWPLTPLFLTAYPSFLHRHYPALAFAPFTEFQTLRWTKWFPSRLFQWQREGVLRRFTIE